MLGRSTPQGRSTPTLVRRDSHRVEDLAFDNLRLARRAAALEAQLERASLASSSSWSGWLGYGPEPKQLTTVLDDELAAKALENEQLHIAIYEQAKDLTKQQRTEAAQRWAALAALRGSLSELESDSEARALEAAATAKRHEDAIATLQQMCLELRLCCASQRDELKALATEVTALRERHATHKQWRRRVRRYLRAAKADGSLLGDAGNDAVAPAAAPAAADEAADVDGGGAAADASDGAADGGAGEHRRLRAALDREGELRRAAEAEAERLNDVLRAEREAAQLAQERLGEQIGVLSDALAKKEEEEERRRQRRQQLQAQQAARAAAGGAAGSGGSGVAGVARQASGAMGAAGAAGAAGVAGVARQASGAVGAAGAAATSIANGLTSVAAAPLSSSISMINGATAFCAKGIDSAATFAEKGLDSAATTVGLGTGGGAVK